MVLRLRRSASTSFYHALADMAIEQRSFGAEERDPRPFIRFWLPVVLCFFYHEWSEGQ